MADYFLTLFKGISWNLGFVCKIYMSFILWSSLSFNFGRIICDFTDLTSGGAFIRVYFEFYCNFILFFLLTTVFIYFSLFEFLGIFFYGKYPYYPFWANKLLFLSIFKSYFLIFSFSLIFSASSALCFISSWICLYLS